MIKTEGILMEFSPELFDPWAANYDDEVAEEDGFPFAGYSDLLNAIVEVADPKPCDTVLDLGCGTGNLSMLFAKMGCQVWGTDFSPKMVERAKEKFPDLHFAITDVRQPLPPIFPKSYDLIVSAYVFHHFPIEEKINHLQKYKKNHLRPGGRMIIGDLMFPNNLVLQEIQNQYTDSWDDEYYWILDQDLPLLRKAGLDGAVKQISFCGWMISFRL
jgi:putative AdoMet-dependent methyltransferase